MESKFELVVAFIARTKEHGMTPNLSTFWTVDEVLEKNNLQVDVKRNALVSTDGGDFSVFSEGLGARVKELPLISRSMVIRDPEARVFNGENLNYLGILIRKKQ